MNARPGPRYAGPRIVNLTGHRVNVVDDAGLVMRLEPDAASIRARVLYGDAGTVRLGGRLPVVNRTVERVSLPPPTPGVFFLVSQLTAMALALIGEIRSDVLYPGPNETGLTDDFVAGCSGLRRITEVNIPGRVSDVA